MLSPTDHYNIRQDAHETRTDYREVYLVYPDIETGTNYEPFTDSPYDISANQYDAKTMTFSIYRARARIKIIQDTSIIGVGQVVPGLEVGDYLCYFRDTEYPQLKRVLDEMYAYIVVDGITFRPNNLTMNGVGRNFDVAVHCKKYSPKFRAEGL